MTKKINHPRYKISCINNDYFSETNMKKYPERYVLVGFIAADGCIYDKRKGQSILCFNLSEKDKNALEMINNEICSGERTINHIKKTNSVTLQIPSTQICSDLSKWNIVPKKTKTYSMPEINLELEMKYFLRGYFYGDGCVSDANGQYSKYVIVGTKNFCSSMNDYLLKKNVIERKAVYSCHSSKIAFKVHYTRRQGAKFSKYIFHDEKMKLIPRKHVITEERIKGSRWTAEEDSLLLKVGIEKFKSISPRTESGILSRWWKISK